MYGWRSVADKISVVVISRNEGRELKRTVENFDDTLPAGSEIIVIDDGSSDGSANHLARRRGRIRLHRVHGYGVARARILAPARHAAMSLSMPMRICACSPIGGVPCWTCCRIRK